MDITRWHTFETIFMNLNTIKSNYSNFDDLKIKNIALKESSSLRPEVIDILKAEIIKRDLSQDLIDL